MEKIHVLLGTQDPMHKNILLPVTMEEIADWREMMEQTLEKVGWYM